MKNNIKLINKLKNDGYKVRIEHYRFDSNENDPCLVAKRYMRGRTGFNPSTFGGETFVSVEKDGEKIEKYSYCNDEDSFCYSLGTRIALNRILYELEKK